MMEETATTVSEKVRYHEIADTPYILSEGLRQRVGDLAARVRELRAGGKLDEAALKDLAHFFRIRHIYNSNAIEGNVLNMGETRMVVEEGITLAGKPLRDQAEAKNLSGALDLLEELAVSGDNRPITEVDIRQIHYVILKNINNDCAGKYRAGPVTISGSRYSPPTHLDVPIQMTGFAAWLAKASMPGQRMLSEEGFLYALVAHTWFVTIHPFIDGNGRVARILLNILLMRYGFPIAIVMQEDRARYYDALEEAQTTNLTPFGMLLLGCEKESLEEYEKIIQRQQHARTWVQEQAARFEAPERVRLEDSFEIWKHAMELLRGYFRQTLDMIDGAMVIGHVYFKDFGMLGLEKYSTLRQGESAKKTWFFRIDFVFGEKSARYLFFFGFPSPALRAEKCDVTIFVAREEEPFNYVKTEQISAMNTPSVVEVGYKAGNEEFVVREKTGGVSPKKLDEIGRTFIEQVIDCGLR